MTRSEESQKAWRNLIADWHLRQKVPMPCRCEEDTSDAELCASSVKYADTHLDRNSVAELDGDTDVWEHASWVAAWGRNAPLVVSPNDFRIPNPPPGMSWLVTRILVAGTKAVEMALIRTGDGPMVTVARSRSVAEPDAVVARARLMLQEIMS
jgi:hypothetical protein